MTDRLSLHQQLLDICSHVYFQPPENLKLTYPCIVYHFDNIRNTKADNRNYKTDVSYSITYIDTNPVNNVVEKLNNMEYCRFNRYFVSDNLYHYVFTIYS